MRTLRGLSFNDFNSPVFPATSSIFEANPRAIHTVENPMRKKKSHSTMVARNMVTARNDIDIPWFRLEKPL